MGEFELDQKVDPKTINNIISYAGVAMKDSGFDYNFRQGNKGSESHTVTKNQTDLENNNYTVVISALVDSASDTIEYEVVSSYHRSDDDPPAARSEEKKWTKLLEKAEKRYT